MKLKPKSPEQMQAAIDALMLEAECCRLTECDEDFDLLVGYAGVLMWASGEGVQSLERLFNHLIAKRDQLMTAYNEAHPGGKC